MRMRSENQNQRSFVALECQFSGGASLIHDGIVSSKRLTVHAHSLAIFTAMASRRGTVRQTHGTYSLRFQAA
jgi:hypothetical protein